MEEIFEICHPRWWDKGLREPTWFYNQNICIMWDFPSHFHHRLRSGGHKPNSFILEEVSSNLYHSEETLKFHISFWSLILTKLLNLSSVPKEPHKENEKCSFPSSDTHLGILPSNLGCGISDSVATMSHQQTAFCETLFTGGKRREKSSHKNKTWSIHKEKYNECLTISLI